MKTITIFLLTSLLLHAYSQAQKQQPLRHFMQAVALPANEPQYGNNPKAGHYATAGDAKIYYEMYGKGQPIVILG